MHHELIALTLQSGAKKATVIDVKDIVLSASFRDICKGNGCGMYGQCWMGPPDIGDIDVLMSELRGYEHGLLYQTIGTLEDSFDLEGMMAAGHRHALVSRDLQTLLPGLLKESFLHLGCGGCHLCEICAKRTGQPCRHPEQALPAMEGYGVDVYNTTLGTTLKYINGTNTVTYFGLVLFTE